MDSLTTLIINTLSLWAGKRPQNVYHCCCCCGSLHLSAGHSHSRHSLSHSPPASKCPLVTVAMGRRTSIFMHLTDSEILKWPASGSRSSQVNLRNILLDKFALIDNINQSGIFPQYPNTQTECHESSVPEYLLNCHGLDEEKHFKIV